MNANKARLKGKCKRKTVPMKRTKTEEAVLVQFQLTAAL